MPPTHPEAAVARAGYLFELSVVAMGLWVGFRFDLVPGGLVGVDVLLAIAGWWAGVAATSVPPVRLSRTSAFRAWWSSVVVVLALAVLWVLTTGATGADTTVRGQALALVGGYGNWHLLAFGPGELAGSRLATPLQHLWPWAVLAQVLTVWVAVVALARRWPRRDGPAALAPVGLVLAIGGLVSGAVQLAVGASTEAITFSTGGRGAAFFLGAALGASRVAGWSDRFAAAARRWFSVPLLGLLVLSVVAEPTGEWWRNGGSVVAPLLAATALAAAAPLPRIARIDRRARVEWASLVAFGVVAGGVLVLADTSRTDVWGAGQRFAALLGALAASVALGALAERMSTASVAIERRRVLVPALVAVLVLVLLSVTGAFGWEGPTRRGDAIGTVSDG